MTRALKGLEDSISVTVVHPIWQKTRPDVDEHAGWIFGNPQGDDLINVAGKGGPFPAAFPNNEPNPLFASNSIREIYEKAGDTEGKYSVPVLWDKKQNTIVSNESADIIRMLNKEFNSFAKNPTVDLAPAALEAAMKDVDDWIYPTINNGVYRYAEMLLLNLPYLFISLVEHCTPPIESILTIQSFPIGRAPLFFPPQMWICNLPESIRQSHYRAHRIL